MEVRGATDDKAPPCPLSTLCLTGCLCSDFKLLPRYGGSTPASDCSHALTSPPKASKRATSLFTGPILPTILRYLVAIR